MNTRELTAQSMKVPQLIPGFSLWFRQLMAITRIEFVKALLSRRALSCYGLALIPVLLLTISGFQKNDEDLPVFETIENARQIYAYVYSTLILGGVIFLGSAAIFTSLFRGEILDRSIHYYVLTPVRREVLVTAKFLAGLASAFILFGLCAGICFLALYIPFGIEQIISDLSNGIAMQQLEQYLGLTLLACMGYGAVFMATGLLFRNPLIPVVVIAGWELIHFILPPALKVFSIIYYLKGLLPIPLDERPLAVLVAPPPVWISISGMLGLCLLALGVTIILLKRLEVRYTDE